MRYVICQTHTPTYDNNKKLIEKRPARYELASITDINEAFRELEYYYSRWPDYIFEVEEKE